MNPSFSPTGRWAFCRRLDDGSGMSREAHVPFCEGLGVRFPRATHLITLCRTERDAKEALRRLEFLMERLGLELHPNKTQLVNLKEGKEGFDFLGFHHRKVRSWRYHKYYLQRWPRHKAMKAIREKIRSIVGHRRVLNWSLREVIDALNPVLRGWGNYFSVGNSSRQFQKIDSYVQERLFLYLSKKHAKSGRGWSTRWRHIDFRAEGLYHLSGTIRWHIYTVNALG